MARVQPQKDRYQKQREELLAAKEEFYSTLGKIVAKGVAEVGGKEKFLSYLGEKSREMGGLESRYGSLILGKESYKEAKRIIYQIHKMEREIERDDEPTWLKMVKGVFSRYEKRKE